jgi:hypothetical protein
VRGKWPEPSKDGTPTLVRALVAELHAFSPCSGGFLEPTLYKLRMYMMSDSIWESVRTPL